MINIDEGEPSFSQDERSTVLKGETPMIKVNRGIPNDKEEKISSKQVRETEDQQALSDKKKKYFEQLAVDTKNSTRLSANSFASI